MHALQLLLKGKELCLGFEGNAGPSLSVALKTFDNDGSRSAVTECVVKKLRHVRFCC